MTRSVLFLCTGNSCRSQMAEAIVNALPSHDWAAYSAGTKPAGSVHPFALEVLREIGIDHRGRSKGVDEVRDQHFDLVVTVCDAAAEECPVWLGPERRKHLGFPDPARATGSREQKMLIFRQVRDAIAEQIPQLLGEDL